MPISNLLTKGRGRKDGWKKEGKKERKKEGRKERRGVTATEEQKSFSARPGQDKCMSFWIHIQQYACLLRTPTNMDCNMPSYVVLYVMMTKGLPSFLPLG